jgi:hypothetical protein
MPAAAGVSPPPLTTSQLPPPFVVGVATTVCVPESLETTTVAAAGIDAPTCQAKFSAVGWDESDGASETVSTTCAEIGELTPGAVTCTVL